MRVLTFTSVFPSPAKPNLGVFVQNRANRLAQVVDLRVAVPVGWLDFSKGRPAIGPMHRGERRLESGLAVRYFRWLYPPVFGQLNGLFMAAFSVIPLLKLRREFDFELLDVHFGYPDGVAGALLAGLFRRRFTVTLRGNETMHASGGLKRRQMRWALRRASAVIAVSNPLKEFAASLGVDRNRIAVVPNGIDTTIFHPRERAECRARLGLSGDRRHILSAGYLIERKGHHRIVEALPALHEAGVPADLWIVGDRGLEGNYDGEIHRAVERLGLGHSVHFVPAVRPAVLAEYMAACDVFCLASTREGWPNVVNEALACGCPAVASDVGGVSDMLCRPEYGLVVPPGDGGALAGALQKALSAEWDRASIAAWGGRTGLGRSGK